MRLHDQRDRRNRPGRSTISTPAPNRTALLSIVVPFYNVESYIEECLVSLRDQLLEDVEIILVDDGSPDGSLAIAERFAAADSRFRIVRQENQGLGPARNTGTRHATGTYLTFVDSDDIVAPRAYTLLVGALEESGSQFAAGNTYRFGDNHGVRQSWTHRKAFRTNRIGTNIDEHPDLMADRMVWNKVYRRSFWDAQGFEFPAIRYEDYPVTLRAYLEAESVDVISDHIYFWRIRTSQDSITQQAGRVDNAHDRFTSAVMTLDILDKYPEHRAVRDRVHNYFAHIDLVSLAESMVSVPEADRPLLEHMLRQFAHRLDPDASMNTTRLARLLHQTVLAGDLTLAGHLARWRQDSDTKALLRNLLASRRPSIAPRALRAVVRPRKVPNPVKPRVLRSHLEQASWNGDVLDLRVEAKLRADVARRVSAEVTVLGPVGPVDVPVTVTPKDGGGLTLDIAIDTAAVDLGDGTHQSEKATGTPGLAHLRIALSLGPLSWVGKARFAPDRLPGIRQTPDGMWVAPRGVGWYLGLQKVASPIVIDRITVEGDHFVLHPGETATGKTLLVRRPAPSDDVPIVIGNAPVRIAARDLVAGDPVDNVVTGRAERPVVEAVPDVDEEGNPTQIDHPVHLAGPTAAIAVDGASIGLERGWYGTLVVRQAPVRAEALPSGTAESGEPVADDAAAPVDGEVVDVEPSEGVEPGTEQTV